METDWIKNRRESGYDFGHLVRAMSKLEVRQYKGSLIVDTSAIESREHFPTQHILLPGTEEDEGLWHHQDAGTTATLMDHLFTAALVCLDRPADASTP